MAAATGIIRQFQPGDAEVCSRIIRDCANLDAGLTPGLREKLLGSESAGSMIDRARRFYVAVCLAGHEVAGVGGIDLNEIRLLFVAPAQQRRGIGGALLAHLESWAPPVFFREIFVYSARGAVGFYGSHGYRPAGEHSFMTSFGIVTATFMTKKLDE